MIEGCILVRRQPSPKALFVGSVVCLVLITLSGVLSASAASKTDFHPQPRLDAPSTTELQQRLDYPVGVMQVVPNPYGCYGQSDKPHLSRHVPGKVNAIVRTECSVAVPWIYAEANLYHLNVFGFGIWQDSGSYGANDARQAYTNAAAECKTGTWVVTGYHQVVGLDRVTYEGYTSNSNNITLCY